MILAKKANISLIHAYKQKLYRKAFKKIKSHQRVKD